MARAKKQAGRGFNMRAQSPPELVRLMVENARRVKCGQCELMILPENMDRHVRICHDW